MQTGKIDKESTVFGLGDTGVNTSGELPKDVFWTGRVGFTQPLPPHSITHAALRTHKRDMHDLLDAIALPYKVSYAPKQRKTDLFDWDLSAAIKGAHQAIHKTKKLSIDGYHEILKTFAHSMRDFHVGVRFASSANASLPLSLVSLGDRTYVGFVDRKKLPEDKFPFAPGDVITTFDDRPVLDVVKELETHGESGAAATDRALASRMLTNRRGLVGAPMPDKGVVTLEGISHASKSHIGHQLAWDFQGNTGASPTSFMRDKSESVLLNPDFSMHAFQGGAKLDEANPDPFGIGNTASFVPALGPQVTKPKASEPFSPYIYRLPNGKLAGCIRLANYSPKDPAKAIASLRKTIEHFEQTVDALVIDQTNNPGGMFLYAYAILQLLTRKPLRTSQHCIALASNRIDEAVEILDDCAKATDDKKMRAIFGKHMGGYPVDREFVKKLEHMARFVLSEHAQGKAFSDPYFIDGVDTINPDPKVGFSKPIVCLTNELDFSNGDFFPAILQDNGRATIFGAETAGAGGAVETYKIPNNLGVASFSVTVTQGIRTDPKRPLIENGGVIPDVAYNITPEDLRGDFKPYGDAVNNEVMRQIGLEDSRGQRVNVQ